jgi:hypothetical protein
MDRLDHTRKTKQPLTIKFPSSQHNNSVYNMGVIRRLIWIEYNFYWTLLIEKH